MIKNYLTWPWILSVPLLLYGYGCSVFFVGTNSPLLAPAVLSLMAVSALTIWPNFKQGWEIPQSYTFLFTVMFWLWICVSIFWSTVPYVSTIFAVILSILPGFFTICIVAANREKCTKIYAGTLWIALACFAVWALIQFFFLFEQYGPRIRHPMLNPNNLAGLFNMGIFPAVAMFILAKKKWSITLMGIIVGLFYAALIVTQSRAGLLSCIVTMLVFLPFIALKNPGGLPWKKLIFLALLAILVPLIGDIYKPGALSQNLVSAKALTNTRSLDDRFYLWESTLKIIREHFWMGTGLATFYFYYPRYRSPLDRSDGFFAHMDPLQFWSEMGVMAPALFYGVLICILLRTINAIKSGGSDFRTRLEIIAPFCGMLALTGHTHLTFHLYMPGILIPLSALLAYWYLATERALGDNEGRYIFKPEGRKNHLVIAGFLIFTLLIGGWIIRNSAATYLMNEVQTAASKQDMKKANKALSLTSMIAPHSYGRYYEFEARFRISKLWDNIQRRNLSEEKVRVLYGEAAYFLDESEKRNPAFTALWDLRARLYFSVDGIIMDDGYERAIEILEKVIEANPLSSDSRVGLAKIYQTRGEIRKAAYALERGIQWPRPRGMPDLNFLVTLAKLKQQLGDQKAHDRFMAEAQKRSRMYGIPITN